MKRISLLTAVILCLCLFVSSCGKQSDVPAGMKLASMEEVSYSFFVPESWIVDLQTKATTAHVSQNDRTSISVTSWDAPNTDYSFEQWEEFSRTELDEGFTDYNELEVNEKIIDGIAAKEYVFTAKLGGVERKYSQTVIIKGYTVFAISYSAFPDVYDTHTQELSQILSEFKFK